MSDRFEFTITQRAEERRVALDALERLAREHRAPLKAIHELQLAVEEHLTNISNHAFEDEREHQIRVNGWIDGTSILVEVQDDGRAFNPAEFPTPDLSLPLDQRPVGGLGIHMMRRSTDEIRYRRDGQKNVVTLRKRIS